MGVVELLTIVFTILTPILSVGVASWADKRKDAADHATTDHVDAAIEDYQQGHRTALDRLSRDLERLQQDAERHRPS